MWNVKIHHGEHVKYAHYQVQSNGISVLPETSSATPCPTLSGQGQSPSKSLSPQWSNMKETQHDQ